MGFHAYLEPLEQGERLQTHLSFFWGGVGGGGLHHPYLQTPILLETRIFNNFLNPTFEPVFYKSYAFGKTYFKFTNTINLINLKSIP